ncbi:MAG: immunity 26/phosphotriesterase HocA family protein [Proteobacteria bacterium]|nr:immunity 26/phosphotriesterase HocA family protein [Pseudomonadota bacterium]
MTTKKFRWPHGKNYPPGAIVEIPLPDGQLCYAKILADGDLAILNVLTSVRPKVREFLGARISFYQCIGNHILKTSGWPVVDIQPLSPAEQSIPPMATCYVRDANAWTMGGVPYYTHQGVKHQMTFEQAEGMNIWSVAISSEALIRVIVDRLVKGNHENYKVRST